MPSDKMKDGNEGDNKCRDPGALGYKLMIYMIVAVILVAIGTHDRVELDLEIERYYSWAYLKITNEI